MESLPTARALLLVSYRPEYQHSWGSRSYYTQFRIDPLPPASAEELLHALLGDDPGLGLLKQTLIDRTEGNPFFLEECVRTLVETRALTGEAGAYRLGREVQTIQMPATVQAGAGRAHRPAPHRGTAAAAGRGGDRHGRAAQPAARHHGPAGGRAPARPGPAAVRGVPLRGEPLPDRRVHVQARAHPGRGVQHAAAGAATAAARPHRGGHRAAACGAAGRTRGASRPSRVARGGLGQGRHVPASGRREGRRARREPRGGDAVRAGARRGPAPAGGASLRRAGHRSSPGPSPAASPAGPARARAPALARGRGHRREARRRPAPGARLHLSDQLPLPQGRAGARRRVRGAVPPDRGQRQRSRVAGAGTRLPRLQLPRAGTLPAGRAHPQAECGRPGERVGSGGGAPDRHLLRHLQPDGSPSRWPSSASSTRRRRTWIAPSRRPR